MFTIPWRIVDLRWSRIKHFRINILAWPSIYLIHRNSFVFSPLNKDLINLRNQRLAQRKFREQQHELASYTQFNHDATPAESQIGDSRCLYYYLCHPKRLFGLIKKYHLVGNGYIIYFVLQFVALIYLWIKAVFHHVISSKDEHLAQYYATHYFPRLFESYSDVDHLYAAGNVVCSYCLIVRGLMAWKLVRRSINNCNGYKHVEVTQLNFTFLATMCWKLEDWIRLLTVGRKHGPLDRRRQHERNYSQDKPDKERQAHLSIGRAVLSSEYNHAVDEVDDMSNIIDFTECYSMHRFEMNSDSVLITGHWYIPQFNCRADLYEMSWLLCLVLMGVPLLVICFVSAFIATFLHELATLDSSQTAVHGSTAQITNLLADPNHLIRLVDMHLLIMSQLPHHSDAAMTYTNLLIFLSRVRKVVERFQEEADFCARRAHHYLVTSPFRYDVADCTTGHAAGLNVCNDKFKFVASPMCRNLRYFPNITSAERTTLNSNLKMNIRLIRSIDKEFQWLRESLTAYFDILLFGCGISVSVGLSVIFVSDSQSTKILFAAALFSILFPLVTIVVFAVLIEYKVSTTERLIGLTLKLDTNSSPISFAH